ncbi:hypothetical protein KL86PLE_90318 [uncultured Pleomorphomonas sp.]|uniref:Uncharacterized protein n=1 Tax=uncultured Pleomorphomonas sp. TaxID=442121 RepID=A0A212LP46_9HYPH|nr:hypothetical protein KL86PLE_90318 [uncultured Pleomorphomonas sp.]
MLGYYPNAERWLCLPIKKRKLFY